MITREAGWFQRELLISSDFKYERTWSPPSRISQSGGVDKTCPNTSKTQRGKC